MSVGCFLGIRASYVDEAQGAASAYIAAINVALGTKGLPAYSDPARPPDVYNGGLFGRSALDHHSAGCLAKLAEMTMEYGPAHHLGLLASNPYRLTFVPVDFPHPLLTDYVEDIAGEAVKIWVASTPRLAKDLESAAALLQIPLQDGQLADSVARRINAFAPLHDGDDCSLAENERTSWLLLYEGARLAVQHRIALSLAG